jgi:LiaF transmembrane domain
MLDQPRQSVSPEAAAIGAVIMMLGVVLLLDQAGIVRWSGGWTFWPFALIGGGLAKLLTRREDGSRAGGWLLFIGVWLLLNDLHVLRRNSWPLFIVAVGISIIWKALTRPSNANVERP